MQLSSSARTGIGTVCEAGKHFYRFPVQVRLLDARQFSASPSVSRGGSASKLLWMVMLHEFSTPSFPRQECRGRFGSEDTSVTYLPRETNAAQSLDLRSGDCVAWALNCLDMSGYQLPFRQAGVAHFGAVPSIQVGFPPAAKIATGCASDSKLADRGPPTTRSAGAVCLGAPVGCSAGPCLRSGRGPARRKSPEAAHQRRLDGLWSFPSLERE